ncbi:hypothetical protein [Marinobacter subterrani]|uniref:Uncharacterized protein n=1 Tax=Marinobacter subterrani TaxID=1658765 RepID=A0A0J7JC96_9GAMM|nr:hypothetical protein [Marinobacter subterrani]KMQ76113.1 hypothetical protein Msub_12322 [Marinobacter subterrani]
MENRLIAANSGMVWSLLGLVLSIVLAYPLAHYVPMAVQVLAHVGTLLFAVGIKVSYIARLVFLSRLGRPVH